MIIKRANNQIIIQVSQEVDTFGLQRIIDYLEYLEITAQKKGSQENADQLAEELNESWWKKNNRKFLK